MKTTTLFASTIALTLIGSAIVSFPKTAIAGQFQDRSARCYFFRGETLELEENCLSNGSSWAGGGGHSLRWSDGVVTMIKFGKHGRGTPICPGNSDRSVDGVCGKSTMRSIKTLKTPRNDMEAAMECVQLEKTAICWRF